MIFSLTEDEKIGRTIDVWEECLASAESFAYWGEGDFEQELFREAMELTWELFSERIDFDAPEAEYALPADLAVILGLVMSYGRLIQITGREDGGDIGLSAMLANDLWRSIQFRESFSRDEPVVSEEHLIDGKRYKLTYRIKTGLLDVTERLPFPFDSPFETTTAAEPTEETSFTVGDLSRWWDA